jgi:diaminopimelate epimerase
VTAPLIKFAKAHAYGNDFLYVEEAALADLGNLAGAALASVARAMCDRHAGVGADGLIVYDRTAAGATMRLFNADGGRAEVSGNGVRGLAALLLQSEDRTHAAVTIETEAGAKAVVRLARAASRQTFRTAMGSPGDLRQVRLTAGGEALEAVVMTFGNPQCILLGPLPPEDRFRRLGAALEHHPSFPDGTNVEFTFVEQPDSVRILIWERGVGPTTSSGTGSCAALVAAAAFGGAAREAAVVAPGGSQRVEWRDDGVYLTGWAEVVCEGKWLLELPH